MNTKMIPLDQILSITTGRLVSRTHMDGVYDILNYMTGDETGLNKLFTHQLPRAAEACAPALLEQHPWLREIIPPEKFNGEDHVREWIYEQEKTYGGFHPIARLTDWQNRDPMAEAIDLVGINRVIRIGGDESN